VPRRQADRENDACAPSLNRNPSDLGSQPHIAPDDRKTNGPKFCRSRFQPRRNARAQKEASAPEVPRETPRNCFLLQPGCCSCGAIFCHFHSSFLAHHPSLITRHIHSPSHAHPVNFYCGNYGFGSTGIPACAPVAICWQTPQVRAFKSLGGLCTAGVSPRSFDFRSRLVPLISGRRLWLLIPAAYLRAPFTPPKQKGRPDFSERPSFSLRSNCGLVHPAHARFVRPA